jgi:hypothetical protein
MFLNEHCVWISIVGAPVLMLLIFCEYRRRKKSAYEEAMREQRRNDSSAG